MYKYKFGSKEPTITLTHPKNILCKKIIEVLSFFGFDASENKYLTKTEVLENTTSSMLQILTSPEGQEYLSTFYGKEEPPA